MARHPNQTNGYNRTFTKPSQSPRAQQATKAVDIGPLPKHPPHRHAFEGGKCKRCGLEQIDST